MLKYAMIFAALVPGATSAGAQQQATLRTIEMPAAGVDVIVATPASPGARYDLGNSPDALIIPLVGGELALGFEDANAMLKTFDILQPPAYSPQAGKEGGPPQPVAVYVVRKGNALASSAK